MKELGFTIAFDPVYCPIRDGLVMSGLREMVEPHGQGIRRVVGDEICRDFKDLTY